MLVCVGWQEQCVDLSSIKSTTRGRKMLRKSLMLFCSLCLFVACCFLCLETIRSACAATTISGTISGNNGEEICVAAVPQLSGSTGCDGMDWNNAINTTSATDGTYSIADVPDGDYYMEFNPQCWGPPETSYLIGEYWTLDGQGTGIHACNQAETFNTLTNTDPKNIVLAAGGIISGTISGTNGQEVCISAHSGSDSCSGWQWVAGERTAADGSYSFGVPVGDYYVNTDVGCSGSNPNYLVDEMYAAGGLGTRDCSMATSVSVIANQTTDTIDIALEQGAQVSGTVSGTNGQESHVILRKLRQDADSNCDTEYVWGENTNTDGTFSFTAPAGTYFLQTCSDCNGANTGNLVDEYWTSDGAGTPYCISCRII